MILTWGRLLSKWRAWSKSPSYDNIMMVISNRSHLWPDHDDRANEWALGKEQLPCPVDISSLRHSPVQPHLVSTYCPNVHPTVCAFHSIVQLVHCTMCILGSTMALWSKAEIKKYTFWWEKIFLRLFFLCCFRKKTLKLVSLFIFRH